MFIKSKNYENCVQRVKIEVGLEAGLNDKTEAYITLKELPTLEMLRLKEATEKSEEETLKLFKELLPLIITDHNFYEDEKGEKKMSNEELSELIFDSITLTMKIVEDYTSASFFTPARKRG